MMKRSSVSRWDLFKFLILRCPTVLWAGIKVDLLDHDQCTVRVKRGWRNRNPYNGVYFANILTAAEMSSGLMVFDEIQQAEEVAGIKLVAVVTNVSATFKRPVKTRAEVCCVQANAIRDCVLDAILMGRVTMQTKSVVRNERGKTCAEVHIDWCITRADK